MKVLALRRETKSDLGIIKSGVLLAFTATYCQRLENGKKCEGDKKMNSLEALESQAAVEMLLNFNNVPVQVANFLRERHTERA